MFTDVIRFGPFAIFCPESEGDIAEDKDLHRLKIKGERVDRALLDKNRRMEVGDRQTAIGEEHTYMVLGDIIADEDDVAIFVSAELVALWGAARSALRPERQKAHAARIVFQFWRRVRAARGRACRETALRGWRCQ